MHRFAPLLAGPPTLRRLLLWAALLWLWLLPGLASAADPAGGFTVTDVRVYRTDGGYRADARIDFRLSPTALEALHNGVPLTFEVVAEVYQELEWFPDDRVRDTRRRFRLRFHAFTRRYLLLDEATGQQRSFMSRAAALKALGSVEGLPLASTAQLAPGERYWGRLRARLDIESLPLPLRPVAYLSDEWRLSSPWYAWPLAAEGTRP